MRKTRNTPSQGKKLVNAVNRLFKAETPVQAHAAIKKCLVATKTLSNVRAVHSWCVNNHGLSIIPLHKNFFYEEVTMDHWVKLVQQEPIYLLKNGVHNGSRVVYRSLHGLAPSNTKITRLIESLWHGKVSDKEKRFIQKLMKVPSRDEVTPVHEEIMKDAGLWKIAA